MIMNIKLTAALAALVAATGMTAFGQGYVAFGTSKNNVYDDFSTPGTSVVAPGDVTATFLWAATGTSDPLGAGQASTGVANASSAWATIQTMLSSGWTVAENFATSNEVDNADTASGVAKGDFNYNSGGSFQLAGTAAGGSYEFVVIAWDNLTGAGTIEQAEDPQAVGWSDSFTYQTGATPGSAISNFSVSGETAFGVSPVPEPASLALAGLGGLSMLFLRRRKS
jgi:hypothetical protein